MSNDDNIKKMAQMLQSGATMLDKYCPVCNNILFKIKNGQIFCPVCEKEIKIVKQKEASFQEVRPDLKSISTSRTNNDLIADFGDLNNLFVRKISELANSLNESKDLFVIDKTIDLVNKMLDIIKKLRDLNYGDSR
jgi:UPF0148 protein